MNLRLFFGLFIFASSLNFCSSNVFTAIDTRVFPTKITRVGQSLANEDPESSDLTKEIICFWNGFPLKIQHSLKKKNTPVNFTERIFAALDNEPESSFGRKCTGVFIRVNSIDNIIVMTSSGDSEGGTVFSINV